MQPIPNGKGTRDIAYSATTKMQTTPKRLETRPPGNQLDSIDFSKNVEFSASNVVISGGNSGNKEISLSTSPKKIQLELEAQQTPSKPKESQIPKKSDHLNEIPEKYDPAVILKMLRSSGPITHLFRIWEGNNRFWFNGSLMTGPPTDGTSNCFTWGAIIIVNIIFYSLAVPFLWNHVHPFFPILSSYLLCMTVGFLLLTSFTDPGIIPRKSILLATRGEIPERYTEKASRETDTLQTLVTRKRKPLKTRNRYCKICQIYRPPKAEHCR